MRTSFRAQFFLCNSPDMSSLNMRSPVITIPRLPDFLIVGTMKSGTTTLIRRLETHPDYASGLLKEPHFYSDDTVWDKGLEWYRGLFASVPSHQRTAEASVTYTAPHLARKVVTRIRATNPDAPLVCILRDPVARLRSHYGHQVQRTREKRPFAVATASPESDYVKWSMYTECLTPYRDEIAAGRLLVVRFEDVMGESDTAWQRILSHVGLAPCSCPTGKHNVTAEKLGYTKTMLRLWESGMVEKLKWVPGPVRRLGKLFLLRNDAAYQTLLEESRALPLAGEVEARLWADAERLVPLLGLEKPLWKTP